VVVEMHNIIKKRLFLWCALYMCFVHSLLVYKDKMLRTVILSHSTPILSYQGLICFGDCAVSLGKEAKLSYFKCYTKEGSII